MRRPTRSLLALALCGALPLTAQDYEEEKLPELGIKFQLMRKLSRLPTKLGEDSAQVKARYQPKDAGDKINGKHGIYLWDLYIYEFSKGGQDAKESSDPRAVLEEERAKRRRATSFKDLVEGDKDPLNRDRRFVVKDKEEPAKGKLLARRYWEYYDTTRLSNGGQTWDQIWYKYAASYDLPDREVALVVILPVQKGERPNERHTVWGQTMVRSVAALSDKETGDTRTAAEKALDAKKETKADTPARKASLERAKKNLAGMPGWDYFTSDNYVVMYGWDPDKPEKQAQMEPYARDLVAKLEKMRLLYQEAYPPHDNMLQTYSTLRICYSIESFMQYSGLSRRGVIGWFNPSTKELVLFRGDSVIGSGGTETVAFHEGWHQYADSYFRKPKRSEEAKAGEEAKPKPTETGDKTTTTTTTATESALDLEDLKGPELHRWFDEGHGDYFGSYVWGNGKWIYQASKMRKPAVKVIVSTGTQVPLREIVTWNKDKFYGDKAPDYYAQAYAMIDFFRRGKSQMGAAWDRGWDKILDNYRDKMLETGDQKKAVEAAFEGVDWDKLEAAWIRWVKEFLK